MTRRSLPARFRDRAWSARRAWHERPGHVLARAVVLAAMGVASMFFVAPVYWLFSAALRPSGTFAVPVDLVTTQLTLRNVLVVLTETAFVDTYLVNSVLVSAATVVLTVGIATSAGYALSQYSLPYERFLMVSLLFVQMIPIVAMTVPLYRVFGVLGLLDTLVVIVVTDTVLVVPIATWLIKGYFDTVPDSLEDAARVGGASRMQAFRVVVPLARPAIAAAAVYAFVISWNQFVIPLTFTSSQAVWTFPVGLYEFISRRGVVQWGLLGAASLVAMLPVLVLFVAFQRQFVVGVAGTGFRRE